MKYIALIFFILIDATAIAQRKTENLGIITLDGMRGQEVYKGVDSALIVDKRFTRDSDNILKNF